MIDTATTPEFDLRRGTLADLRALDLRAADRDFWADEAALWDRFSTSWAGLDDDAWRVPGCAPSDAGGPDWSLAEHVGHIADWHELAAGYVQLALDTGQWPSDDDYDGGDFDTWNERRREPWASMPAAVIRDRLAVGRARLVEVARRLSLETILSDAGWGWVYGTLHGHRIDHLPVIEPWIEALRVRQADGDPFEDDPRATSHEEFAVRDAAVQAQFDALVRPVPLDRWTEAELTPGWRLRQHVAHLADWAAEGRRAIDVFRATGAWEADPAEGIDAWNDRQIRRAADEPVEAVLARYEDQMARMRAAVATLSLEELRSPDGWGWAYDCLYGHVRKHLALVGPWCASVEWPPVPSEDRR